MKPSRELIKPEPGLEAIDGLRESGGSSHSYNYGVDPNADSDIHLLDYWRAVRKRLWLVISIVVLITMLSVVYVEAARRAQVPLAGVGLPGDLGPGKVTRLDKGRPAIPVLPAGLEEHLLGLAD